MNAKVLLSVLFALSLPITAAAGPGDLDPLFDLDGMVTTIFNPPEAGKASDGRAVALQGDGKIVVAGGVVGGTPTFYDFALARYNPDGSLDTSFGEDGTVTTPFLMDHERALDAAEAVAIQGDGKIIAVGSSDSKVALARYNQDGSLDSGFGIGGQVVIDYSGSTGNDRAMAVAIQKDGKILVAGDSYVDDGYDFSLAQFNPDGTLDTTFGIAGVVFTDFGTPFDRGEAMDLTRDGKILVGGRARVGGGKSSNDDFALARYSSLGFLDPTFGDKGLVTTDVGGRDDGRRSISHDKDENILMAGHDKGDFALARYDPDGSFDETFGIRKTDLGSGKDQATCVTPDLSGRIVVIGSTATDFAVIRYDADGNLDGTFGEGGVVTTDLGDKETAAAGIIQPDGKIIAAGKSGKALALARYRVAPGISIKDTSVMEEKNDVEALFEVSIKGDFERPITVDFETGDWEAADGPDYGYTAGSLNFEPGETTKTISVIVHPDDLAEGEEHFKVFLSNAVGADLDDDEATGTIEDFLPKLSLADVTAATEGNLGEEMLANVEVTLSAPTSHPVTVFYKTWEETAMENLDYKGTEGTLEIPPGETKGTIPVVIVGDDEHEIDERFWVRLENPVNATLGDGDSIIAIAANDLPTLSIDDVSVKEDLGVAVFTVTLSKPDDPFTIEVSYSTENGGGKATAFPDVDYTAGMGQLTFEPGETAKTIEIVLKDDRIVEPDDTFLVTLFDPVHAEITDDSGTGTILNDDILKFDIRPPFTVDSESDDPDKNPGDEICATVTGNCTLRAAIQETNALEGGDTIEIPAGTYKLAIPGAGEDAAETGDLDIWDDLTLRGAGESLTIIDGGGLDRVFHIPVSANVLLERITCTGGRADTDGGCLLILDGSWVSLTQSTLQGNQANHGGAIATWYANTLSLKETSIIDNEAVLVGGGIYNGVTTISIERSLIASNVSGGDGGALYSDDGQTILVNSTLSGNKSGGHGGAIMMGGLYTKKRGTAFLENVTVAFNQAAGAGGGIYSGEPVGDGALVAVKALAKFVTPVQVVEAKVILDSTLVSNNQDGRGAAAPDLSGNFESAGYNLVGSHKGNKLTDDLAGNLIGEDPLLDALTDNGGPTKTHALSAGSPAIDACNPKSIQTVDQRGAARPADGDGDGSSLCDIGAFEYQPPKKEEPEKDPDQDEKDPGDKGDEKVGGKKGKPASKSKGGSGDKDSDGENPGGSGGSYANCTVAVMNYLTGEKAGTGILDANGNFSLQVDSARCVDPKDPSRVSIVLQGDCGGLSLNKYYERDLDKDSANAAESLKLSTGDLNVESNMSFKWLEFYAPEQLGCFETIVSTLFERADWDDDDLEGMMGTGKRLSRCLRKEKVPPEDLGFKTYRQMIDAIASHNLTDDQVTAIAEAGETYCNIPQATVTARLQQKPVALGNAIRDKIASDESLCEKLDEDEGALGILVDLILAIESEDLEDGEGLADLVDDIGEFVEEAIEEEVEELTPNEAETVVAALDTLNNVEEEEDTSGISELLDLIEDLDEEEYDDPETLGQEIGEFLNGQDDEADGPEGDEGDLLGDFLDFLDEGEEEPIGAAGREVL